MKPCEKCKASAPEHDIVKMSDYKISAVNVNIRCESAVHQPGKAADGKKKDEGDDEQ